MNSRFFLSRGLVLINQDIPVEKEEKFNTAV